MALFEADPENPLNEEPSAMPDELNIKQITQKDIN